VLTRSLASLDGVVAQRFDGEFDRRCRESRSLALGLPASVRGRRCCSAGAALGRSTFST
jgi:hypothetical protein